MSFAESNYAYKGFVIMYQQLNSHERGVKRILYDTLVPLATNEVTSSCVESSYLLAA